MRVFPITYLWLLLNLRARESIIKKSSNNQLFVQVNMKEIAKNNSQISRPVGM